MKLFLLIMVSFRVKWGLLKGVADTTMTCQILSQIRSGYPFFYALVQRRWLLDSQKEDGDSLNARVTKITYLKT